MNDSRLSIFQPIPQGKAYYDVKVQATYYPQFARVFIPKVPFEKLLPDLEAIDITEIMSGTHVLNAETNMERSLRRSRKAIKDLVFCNKFEQFITLTVAIDRQNVEHSKLKVINWIKNEQKRKGKFEYIIVPEYHKDGQSLHFHGLLKSYKGEIKQSYTASNKPVIQGKRKVYQLPSYTSGFTNVKLIDNQQHTPTKIGFYIQKYITKDMPRLFGKNRYWASRGLKRPVVIDNPERWYKLVAADRKYENDYGTILEFDAGKNEMVDIFIGINRP